MPVWLRRFTFHKLKEYYESQKGNSSEVDPDNINKLKEQFKEPDKEIKREIPKPSYTVKVPTKK